MYIPHRQPKEVITMHEHMHLEQPSLSAKHAARKTEDAAIEAAFEKLKQDLAEFKKEVALKQQR